MEENVHFVILHSKKTLFIYIGTNKTIEGWCPFFPGQMKELFCLPATGKQFLICLSIACMLLTNKHAESVVPSIVFISCFLQMMKIRKLK